MPDQVKLIVGDQAFSDEHVVECRLDDQHVRGGDQTFIHLVGIGFFLGDGACDGEQRGRGTGHDENEETDGDQIVDCQSQQQCTKHAIRVCSCAGYRTQLYAGEMSAGSEVATAIAVSQPRRAVIDRAWRAIGPGVEVLSGSDGGPLRRTVKRILDPLVLRLRSNPQFSAAVRAPDTAAAVRDLIVDHAGHLRAAAAWFALLKTERRRLHITTGNAQELYFPVCFELAVTRGAPQRDDRAGAEAVLLGVHQERDRTAIERLNAYVDA